MISLQTASPLHENCLHPMTLPPLPNEVVDSIARSIPPICAKFYLRIGLGMAMALAVI